MPLKELGGGKEGGGNSLRNEEEEAKGGFRLKKVGSKFLPKMGLNMLMLWIKQ